MLHYSQYVTLTNCKEKSEIYCVCHIFAQTIPRKNDSKPKAKIKSTTNVTTFEVLDYD